MSRLLRNVNVYSPHNQPPVVLAGFWQHGSVSTAMFHHWLRITLAEETPEWNLYLADDGGNAVQPLQPLNPDSGVPMSLGNFALLSSGGQAFEVELTAETYRPRTLSSDITRTSRVRSLPDDSSLDSPYQPKDFRDRIRERDGRCCVTGNRPPGGAAGPIWAKFIATHIFPVAHLDVWNQRSFGQLITDDAPYAALGPSGTDSIQNGLLLRADVHNDFDYYLFAIDPDSGYRLIDFQDVGEYDGAALWRNTEVPENLRPHDQLLREHLRQCVLANVKGTGRTGKDWYDHEEHFDAATFSTWGEGNPSRFELEMRTRLPMQ